MKHLCLICAERRYMMESRPPEDARRHFAEYHAYTDDICRHGHYVGANRVQPPETAVTVRVRNGAVSATDGPFAETREHLGGYYLIEAADLNEAIRIAARIPGAQYGSVEVRPVAQDADTQRVSGAAAAQC
jgi:hypothetical protein